MRITDFIPKRRTFKVLRKLNVLPSSKEIYRLRKKGKMFGVKS